jgi:homoserine dehydrogenase
MAELRVGLVGFGTIGTGVVRILREHHIEIERRLGLPLRLARIADIDLERDRGVSTEGIELTRSWREVALDPGIDVVVELVGGTTIAREIVREALAAGKPVVTANKALLAHHGPELYAEAHASGVEIGFEASVGGTIPVLRALREGLCADRLSSVLGIVNGTCNYILTEMESRREPYPACLKRAQDLGYAEADPTADVSGLDSMHKLVILIGLAFGAHVEPDDIETEGIERVQEIDIEYAESFGLRIKLLALAKLREGALEAAVRPVMIPQDSVLARVDGSMNAVEIAGAASGPTLYYGAGAGSMPTASAVVADVMEAVRTRRLGGGSRVPPLGTPELRELPVRRQADLEGEFYLRFSVADRPNVLAHISGALGARGISIASVLQPERHASEAVPVVIVTHLAKESSLREALAEIDRLVEVTGPSQAIRIEREI